MEHLFCILLENEKEFFILHQNCASIIPFLFLSHFSLSPSLKAILPSLLYNMFRCVHNEFLKMFGFLLLWLKKLRKNKYLHKKSVKLLPISLFHSFLACVQSVLNTSHALPKESRK